MELSIVVPTYNEEENIAPFIKACKESIEDISYEIIFTDDGSTDGTKREILNNIEHNITLIEFSRNYGQTSAISAGIDQACGDYIATIDGDLQNDPRDIPKMLSALIESKVDIVAGRRANRKDKMLLRKIPSLIANYIIRKLTKVNIKDYGCTLKIFKSSLAKRLDLYGELHRFIPILANLEGAKIIEIDVAHHPRIYGESKYGINRTFKVISDLLLMYFFQKYRQKPMHLFGNLGITMFLGGSFISLYLAIIKIMGHSIANKPLFYIAILLIITSVQLITIGFISEQIMRIYYGSSRSKPYNIANVFKNNEKNKY